MARKKLDLVLEDITIESVAAEGKALAHYDGAVVFVESAVPGDVVDIRIIKKKPNYMEGLVVKMKKPSEHRLKPFCEHFGFCGGCKWQPLPYEMQLQAKQQQVWDFDKVLDIKRCWLQRDPSNDIRNFIREYTLKHGFEYFDIRANTGFIRNMFIRTTEAGDVMLIVCFFHDDPSRREGLFEAVLEAFPQIKSLYYVINHKLNDSISDQECILYKGEDAIYEQMEGLKFKIGPKSFYQTNSPQAYRLYSVARELACLTGSEVVYDLYTGIGTIAQFVSGQASKVIGIEYVSEAIEDAVANAAANGITNCEFFAGDMKDILTPDFVAEHGRPDVIILDPPRAGIHPDVAEVILGAEPDRIVYVSCNPASQARDLAILGRKYTITAVQPVDMFPHTQHVENVCALKLKNESFN